jgi:hypothetical protein
LGGNVAILLGGTGGTFGAPAYFGPMSSPIGLAVGDFDADTDDDVATANYGDGQVSVLLQVDTVGYARPKGASPINFRLVPAFNQCTSSNGSHGPPLAQPSCNPPTPSSSYLTLNAPDRPAPHNTAASGIGYVNVKTMCSNFQNPPCPTAGDQEDVQFSAQVSDVRCVATGPNCAGAGFQYHGKVLFHFPVRITDRHNGTGQTAPATAMDTQLQFGVQCGSGFCSTVTTADSIYPGAVLEQRRAVWGLGKVELRDGGPDGDLVDADPPAVGTCPPACKGNGGEAVFMHQGFFVP